MSKNTIIKSFVGTSPLQRVRILMSHGDDNLRDLVRISGVSYSNFIRLGYSSNSKQRHDLSKGVGAGADELHFIEMLAKCIDLGIIDGSVQFYSDSDFVKSITNNYSPNARISVLHVEPDVNLDVDLIVLSPDIGGYVAKDYNVDMIKSINDFSVKQLDIMHTGIAELNPRHIFLDEIENLIQSKITKR